MEEKNNDKNPRISVSKLEVKGALCFKDQKINSSPKTASYLGNSLDGVSEKSFVALGNPHLNTPNKSSHKSAIS